MKKAFSQFASKLNSLPQSTSSDNFNNGSVLNLDDIQVLKDELQRQIENVEQLTAELHLERQKTANFLVLDSATAGHDTTDDGREETFNRIIAENQQLSQLLATREDELVRLNSENAEIKQQMYDASLAFGESESEIQNLNTEVSQLKQKEAELKTVASKLEKSEELLTTREFELVENHKKLQAAKDEINAKEKSIADLELRYQKLENELLVRTRSDSEPSVAETLLAETREQLRIKSDELIEKVKQAAQLESRVQDLLAKNSTYSDNIRSLGDQLKNTENERSKLNSELDEVLNELTKAENHSSETSRMLKSQIDKAESDLKAELEKQTLLKSQLDNTVAEKLVLESKLSTAVAEKEGLFNKCSQQDSQIAELKAKIRGLEESIVQNKTAIVEYDKKVSNLNGELSQWKARHEEFTQIQAKLLQTEADLDARETVLAQTRGQLKTVNEDLTKANKLCEQMVIEKTDLINQCTSKAAQIKSLEGKLAAAEEERKLAAAKVEQLSKSLVECEMKYRDQIERLTSEAEEARITMKTESAKYATFQAQFDEVLGGKLEMEAKLSNIGEEKRLLIERCLNKEEECENLKVEVTEIRRKLDDAIAALHELGRENQSLQIEQTKMMNRKWADDSQVKACCTCNKPFGVTVRKHHCRNCGQIFCNECSSHRATLPLAPSLVRVCDSCFKEVSKNS